MSQFTVVTKDPVLMERLHTKMMAGEMIQLEGVPFMPIEQNIENGKKLTLSAKSVEYVSVLAGTGRISEAWTGEGLPPIGTVCEFNDGTGGEWKKVEVMYLSQYTIIVKFDGPPGEDVEGAYSPEESTYFRPIRTPNPTHVALRNKACDEMFGVILSLPEDRRHNCSDIVEALYDAGYRKFEIVDGGA